MKLTDKKINAISKEYNLSTQKKYGISELDIFLENVQRYIKAIREGRMLCIVDSVSKSGMSRTLRFLECSGTKKKGFNYLNFFTLFDTLGYKAKHGSQSFRVTGCGMDMIFHTNYSIIHKFKNIGLITEKECSELCQKTPVTL